MEDGKWKYEGKDRIGAYGLFNHEVKVILALNKEEWTEDGQDEFGDFLCNCAAAYYGYKLDPEKVVHWVNRTAFAFDRPSIPEWVINFVQNALHWAFSLAQGMKSYKEKYLKDLPDELDKPIEDMGVYLGHEYHIGKKLH